MLIDECYLMQYEWEIMYRPDFATMYIDEFIIIVKSFVFRNKYIVGNSSLGNT